MRFTPFAAALAAAFPVAALAADIVPSPPPPPIEPAPVYESFSWTGPYIGVSGGYGWGGSEHTDTLGVTSGGFDIGGGLVGFTVGHNWQRGNLVLGLESDLSWSDINGSTVAAACGVSCSTDIEWFGTTRARLGVAHGRHLFYATGGIAYGDVKSTRNTGAVTITDTDTEIGWTAGAAYEVALTENWSLKGEYLAVGLEDAGYTAGVPVSVDSGPVHIVRGGLNFWF